MRNEVASLPSVEGSVNAAYTRVAAISEVAKTMRLLATTGIEQFGLVTITLHFRSERGKLARQMGSEEQSVEYFLGNVRPLVRRTDRVLLLQHTMYFILLGANLEGARIVQERLWEALLWRLHTIPTQIQRPLRVRGGYSAYPQTAREFERCVEACDLVCREFEVAEVSWQRKSRDGELAALAHKLGIPYLALLPHDVAGKIRQWLSPQLALELCCCPLGREHDVLTVAMADPQNELALERLRKETGLRIFPVLANPRELQAVLEQVV